MNIFDFLDEGSGVTLKYYGVQDIATSWDIKRILDNQEKVLQYYDQFSADADIDIDIYVDYLFLKKIVAMGEVIPALNEEADKSRLNMIVTHLNPIFVAVPTGNLIKYLNQGIEDIFVERENIYDIHEVTLELCSKFQNGLSDRLFEYLINEHSHLLFYHYDDFQSTLEKRSQLFGLLFQPSILEEALDMNLNEITSIIVSVKNRRILDLSPYITTATETIVNYGSGLVDTINVDNVMYHDQTIHKIFDFLVAINDVRASQYEEYVKKSEALLDQHIQEQGHKREYRIPAEEIAKMLRAEGPWFNKLLQITHTKEESTGEIIPSLNQAPAAGHSLVDLVSTNIPTNGYFTYSHQTRLNLSLHVGAVANHILLTDEKLFDECGTWTLSYWQYIKETINYTEQDIDSEICVLFQMFQNVFGLPQGVDVEMVQSLSYGPCMFICALTEKIMRTVYKCLMRNTAYVPLDKVTMGNLLSDGNELFVGILGEHQIKNLRFYFCTDGDTRVGRDYRNKLAHWNGIQLNTLSPFLICELLYLLFSVLTSFFSYFVKNSELDESETTPG